MARKSIKDPVCGMMVKQSEAKLEKIQGHTYGFCSETCADKFKSHPESYLPPLA